MPHSPHSPPSWQPSASTSAESHACPHRTPPPAAHGQALTEKGKKVKGKKVKTTNLQCAMLSSPCSRRFLLRPGFLGWPGKTSLVPRKKWDELNISLMPQSFKFVQKKAKPSDSLSVTLFFLDLPTGNRAYCIHLTGAFPRCFVLDWLFEVEKFIHCQNQSI